MENRNQFAVDGQELEQDDVQAIIDNAAFADDHVFAELLRMLPAFTSTPSRGIMPWAFSGFAGGSLPTALISPNGASGSVLVSPFRAFIGSRTLVGTDAKLNLRDIRSALSVAAGSTSLTQVMSFAANSSGNPRWDLICAAVAIDANATTETRYVKDTTDDDATPQTVVTQVATTVTLQVVAGTAAASPVPPAAPADASGIYYIPLAYVRVPNGFGATSTVLTTDIATIAPLVGLNAKASGAGIAFEPIDSVSTGLLLAATSNAGWKAWGSTGTRPPAIMPSTARGGFSKEIAIDLSASGSSIAPTNNSAIDTSRDWRNRRFLILTTVGLQASSLKFPWEGSADTLEGSGTRGRPINAANASVCQAWTASASHFADTAGLNTYINSHATILQVLSTDYQCVSVSAPLDLVVDMTTGALAVSWSGSPAARYHIFIIATAQYENQ